MRYLIILVCSLAAACNSPLPDERICAATMPTVEQANAQRNNGLARAKTPQQILEVERLHVDTCVRRWAWRLAAVSGSAGEVAAAAMAGCAAPMRALQAAGTKVASSWVDQQTGEAITSVKALDQQVRARTVFYVMQGRAGGCRTK